MPVFWFDLDLTYETIERLEKLRGKRSQMDYIKEALIEKLERNQEA